jgi:hypothetical protein
MTFERGKFPLRPIESSLSLLSYPGVVIIPVRMNKQGYDCPKSCAKEIDSDSECNDESDQLPELQLVGKRSYHWLYAFLIGV